MMGAAMLKRHQFVRSLWALYRLVVSSIMWGTQAQPLFTLIIGTVNGRERCSLKTHLIASFYPLNPILLIRLFSLIFNYAKSRMSLHC